MEIVNSNYVPEDPRLIDHIVYELKSQGIFDNFRKECIADVDTKPAYQNLRQRVEGSVSGFLKTQRWKSDMNKNHVREMLRKNISESGFLETGVERIVDQVVNPKINSIFLPQVENVVYKFLGIQKPTAFDELKAQSDEREFYRGEKATVCGLLPNDLEAVSPDLSPFEKKVNANVEMSQVHINKMDDDESPPFEPLEECNSFVMQEENSVDSHMSGFSGLASHDSNNSFGDAHKITPLDISNPDSHLSKQSFTDHLSFVAGDNETEINEYSSNHRMAKMSEINSRSNEYGQDLCANQQQGKTELGKRIEKPKTDEKRHDKHRSSDKHKSRHDSKSDSKDRRSGKDRKSERDKKDNKDRSKHSSKDSKDKEKRDGKGKEENKGDKDYKSDKDKDRKSSSSRHSNSNVSNNNRDRSSSKRSSTSDNKSKDKLKEPRSKESKDRNDSSKNRDESKTKHETKNHKSDSKSHSTKHNGKSQTDSSDTSKTSKSDKRDDKSQKKDHHRSDKSSHKKDEKREKDKKDSKKEVKKLSKDDHYSSKIRNLDRRSTDRDSSDGHSGTHSSSSSFVDSSCQLQKSSQDSSLINSNSGESGNSDQAEEHVTYPTEIVTMTLAIPQLQAPSVKLIKPKFASNIFEARRLMKIRKKLGKIEKQRQIDLLNTATVPCNAVAENIPNDIKTNEVLLDDSENSRRLPNILMRKSNILKMTSAKLNSIHVKRKHLNTHRLKKKTRILNNRHRTLKECRKHLDTEKPPKKTVTAFEEETSAEVVEVNSDDVDTSLQHSVVSKASWDAIEAMHLKDILKVHDHSYIDSYEEATNKENEEMESKIDGDCLYLISNSSLDTQQYFDTVFLLMNHLEENIKKREILLKIAHSQKEKMLESDTEISVHKRLPKIAIVDISSDNEVIISPRKGVKRQHDVHNNNVNKTINHIRVDKLKILKESPKSTVLSKDSKKARLVDGTVHHVENFILPLSPAESDKSFTTGDKNDTKVNRKSTNINRATNNMCNQRYSTSDLYKPRLQFNSSRRRTLKKQDLN